MDEINAEIILLKAKIELVLQRQEETAKLMAENNVLLRRNIGLVDVIQTTFPVESKIGLKRLEKELETDKRFDVVSIFLHKNIFLLFYLKNKCN